MINITEVHTVLFLLGPLYFQNKINLVCSLIIQSIYGSDKSRVLIEVIQLFGLGVESYKVFHIIHENHKDHLQVTYTWCVCNQ